MLEGRLRRLVKRPGGGKGGARRPRSMITKDLAAIDKVDEYLKRVTVCRRVALLNFFGERYARGGKCGNCDVCVGSASAHVDLAS